MAQSNVKLTVDATQAQRALKGVQTQTQKLNNAVGGLRTALAGVGVTLIAKQAVSAASDFQALQLRMKVLTSEFGEFAAAQELVRKAQDQFNLSIVEATQGITDIFARLRPLGISLKDIEKTFFGFNSIAKLAGLTAQESSAAFTQLAQGLGSGRLQGDEFRSIAEQVPQLLKAISDETGIASGKLKDFASKGLLTSDIILRALAKSADEAGGKIKQIIDESPAETFKSFSNAALELQLTLGDKLLPTILKVTKAATALVNSITKFVDSELGQVTGIFLGIAAAVKAITIASSFASVQILTLVGHFKTLALVSAVSSGTLGTTSSMALLTGASFAKATAAVTAFKIALAKTGIGLVVIGLGFLAAALLKANNEQKNFNKLLKEGSTADINEQIKLTTIKINELQDELANVGGGREGRSSELRINRELDKANQKVEDLKLALEGAENRELTREFNSQLDILKNQNAELTKSVKRDQIKGEEKKKEFDLEQQIAEIKQQFSGEEEARLISLAKQNHELNKQKTSIEQMNEAAKRHAEIFREIGDSIATGVSDALHDAVMGTRSLGEAARAIVNDLASSLLRLGINTLLSRSFGGIFSNLPGLANGGRASAGRSYLVGERGPEIFTPKASGTVIPNNQIGGAGGGIVNNINVNVSAEGMQSNANEDRGKELGVALASAIQSELIKQKRPGGLLAT